MVNVNCSGGQDRNTTTSETHPKIPPPKTKNCYALEAFDRSLCGTTNDGACDDSDIGMDSQSCKPDDYGGYCEKQGKFYISAGSGFREIEGKELLDRYKLESSDTDVRVRRALNDQERRMTNKIRELQITDEYTSRRGRGGRRRDTTEDNEVHESVINILFNVGMTSLLLIFLISVSIILVQQRFI